MATKAAYGVCLRELRRGEGGNAIVREDVALRNESTAPSVEAGLKESLTLHQRNGSLIMGPD